MVYTEHQDGKPKIL